MDFGAPRGVDVGPALRELCNVRHANNSPLLEDSRRYVPHAAPRRNGLQRGEHNAPGDKACFDVRRGAVPAPSILRDVCAEKTDAISALVVVRLHLSCVTRGHALDARSSSTPHNAEMVSDARDSSWQEHFRVRPLG